MLGWGLVGLVLATGLGCGRRAARTLPDLAIPVICTSEIRLLGCDARVEPPKCRSARVTYRRGCEEVRVHDYGWGVANDRNLLGRFTTQTFTLPRVARSQTYFLRLYDSSSPPRYSRYAAALHVDIPL